MGYSVDGGSPLEDFLADFDALSPTLAGVPEGFRCDGVFTSGIGGGVELLYLTGHAAPRADELRRVWRERNGRRAVPVLAVAAYATVDGFKADLVGLRDDQPHQRGVDLDRVERAAQAALDAGSTLEAERLLQPLFAAEEDTGLPSGLRNEGLFAAWELTEHVPRRADWARAGEQAKRLRGRRNIDLLTALGWKSTPLGSAGHLIGDGEEDRAVAVLLQDDELFERRSRRWGDVSPVEKGLSLAHRHRVRWVVAVQGDLVRLYSANVDVGVGRKGASSTYTELHLAALDDERLAYVPLLLSPGALAQGGSVEQILESSADHATSLGARLRDRVYRDVVPRLAETVADRLDARTDEELAQAYHVTLVVLFRLLFVAYAEDRALLPYKRNTVYTRVALKTRARQYTDQQREHGKVEHSDVAFDVWNDLTDIWRAVDAGHREWGVPAYSGGLFSDGDERGRAIAGMRLTNAEIGPALVALLVDTGKDGTFGPVDFQALSVREFGTIYEGLLESSLSLAPVALTLDERESFVPAGPRDTIVVPAGRVYFHNASGARKATGSYFTKQFAVEHLLGAALEPAIDDHLARVAALLEAGDEAGAGEAFFDLRVADIAMGSGHFLIGAVDHVAMRMSAFLAERPVADVDVELGRLRETAVQRLTDVGVTELPEIDPANLLRRQVARRCIYGVDINQIAVDLARLALWIHTFVPGLPMSSLEHGLVQGNALTGIGTLDEALDVLSAPPVKGKRVQGGGERQMSLFEDPIREALGVSRDLLLGVKRTAEATAAEVAEAAAAYRAALAAATPAAELLDAAVAGRLGLVDLLGASVFGPEVVRAAARATEVRERLDELDVLHFPVAFPEVFLRERPGFDVILGNPPWEELQVEELKFWAREVPGLKGKKPQEQLRAVTELRVARPALHQQYEQERDAAEALRPIFLTGPFPGLGTGDLDLYRVFAWRQWQLLTKGGRTGVVLPRTVLNSEGSALWRSRVLAEGSFARVDFLVNSRGWVFDAVHQQYSVGLVSCIRDRSRPLTFTGPHHSLSEFERSRDVVTSVSTAEFETWSSNLSFPLLPSAASGRVFRVLRAHPRLDDWGDYRAVREFDATNDRSTFDDGDRRATSIPVYTGRTFDLWTPDTGQYYAWADPRRVEAALQAKRCNQHRNKRTAYYGLPQEWIDDPTTLPMHRPRIAFRDIARSTDSRTVIAALLPPEVVATNKAPWLFSRGQEPRTDAFLLAVLSSVPLDWYARRWVELSLNIHILNGLPVPVLAHTPLHDRAVQVSGRLAAVDERYAGWAAQVGVPVGSVTDPSEKADLVAELDALVSLLYGLERDDVQHVFETFHRGWAHQQRLTAVLGHYDRWARA